jgi:hypothetical protein
MMHANLWLDWNDKRMALNIVSNAGDPPLDHLTLASVGFVAAGLAKVVEPGNFVLAAVDRVLKTKTNSALDFACRAFDSLDGATRYKVWHLAERDAKSWRLERIRLLNVVPRRKAPLRQSATPDPYMR